MRWQGWGAGGGGPGRPCIPPSRSVGRKARRRFLATAHVAATDEAEMIAEMWLQAARPVADPRRFPRAGLLHLRHGEVIERHVLPVAAGAAEAAGAQDARDRAERRNVLLVVPLVELGLEVGRD